MVLVNYYLPLQHSLLDYITGTPYLKDNLISQSLFLLYINSSFNTVTKLLLIHSFITKVRTCLFDKNCLTDLSNNLLLKISMR